MAVMSSRDGKTIDLAAVFPAKGDSRRPPDWWGRALLYVAIAVFLSAFVWRSWGKVDFVVLDVIIALFIALAIEPLVIRLVRHGWKRGAASAVSLIGLIVASLALLALFGNMFVQQVISMARGFPGLYDDFARSLAAQTGWRLPAKESLGGEILKNIQTSWITNFAGQAVSTTVSMLGALLNLLTVAMVTFYVSAAGPKMRRSLCQWMAPTAQRRFLLGWTTVQDQISGFLFSRSILALINAVCMSIFLVAIHVPYWLPLALFCGLTSQFIPTVGTYIGGALPVLFAWASNGLGYGLAVLVFIVVYQQIENLLLAPKISERTMDLNPAVAFLCVLVFGAIFGALGAFLALPVTASLQSIFKVYTRRYELVDSPLMSDPNPVRKSKVVEGAEAFNERVIKPVSERMPRAVRGSSARVPVDEEVARMQRELYAEHQRPSSDGDDNGDGVDESRTVAIPKNALSGDGAGKHLNGVEPGAGHRDDASHRDDAAREDDTMHRDGAGHRDDGTPTNPRSGWRR